MASGPVSRTNRPNTWLLRPALQRDHPLTAWSRPHMAHSVGLPMPGFRPLRPLAAKEGHVGRSQRAEVGSLAIGDANSLGNHVRYVGKTSQCRGWFDAYP